MKTIVLSDDQYYLMVNTLKDWDLQFGVTNGPTKRLVSYIEGKVAEEPSTEPKPEKPVEVECRNCRYFKKAEEKCTIATHLIAHDNGYCSRFEPMVKVEEKCEFCEYCTEAGERESEDGLLQGICHRYPPVLIDKDNAFDEDGYVQTHVAVHYCHCGEFKQKQKEGV